MSNSTTPTNLSMSTPTPVRHLRLAVANDAPVPEMPRTPEAEQEAIAAADLHEARVRLWTSLLALPNTLSHLAGSDLGLTDEAVAPAFAVLTTLRASAEETAAARETVAQWLAETDRPLEHAAGLIESGEPTREAALAWDEVQRQRGAFAAKNFRLVASIVRRYMGRGIDREDLLQEGTVGLLKAVDRFDHSRGFRFATYATWWVRNSLAHLVSGGRLVRVPPRARRAQFHYLRLHEDANARGESPPSENELAAQGLSPRVVRRLSLLPSGGVQSIDPARDVNASDANASQAPAPDKRIELEGMLAAVERTMQALTARQCEVLERRFGLRGREVETLTEIGTSLSLTAERVRQIEKSAVEALRCALLQSDPDLPIAANSAPRRSRSRAA